MTATSPVWDDGEINYHYSLSDTDEFYILSLYD